METYLKLFAADKIPLAQRRAMLAEVQKRNRGFKDLRAAVDPADPPGIPEFQQRLIARLFYFGD